MALWVRSPTSSASGEAVEPEIVAEAKIGTYKSAELDWRPAACPTAQLAGPGGSSVCVGRFLPPSPTPFGTRSGQDSANRGCSVSGHPMLQVSPEVGDPGRQR